MSYVISNEALAMLMEIGDRLSTATFDRLQPRASFMSADQVRTFGLNIKSIVDGAEPVEEKR